MGLIDDPVMERRCRALVATVELPDPLTVDGLIQVIANQQGIAIESSPLPLDYGPEVSGAVFRGPQGYHIQHPPGLDSWSLLATCHELAHVLAGHLAVGEQMHTDYPVAPTSGGRATAVHLEDMQEAIAAWGALYRCSMAQRVEQEAEFIATLLVQRIGGTIRPGMPANQGTVLAETENVVLSRYSEVLFGRPKRRKE